MDKAVLRNFAIESRKDLMEKIDRKIKLFYVDEEFKKDNRGDVIVLSNNKHSLTLTKEEDSNRDKLIKRIVQLGYDHVVEEAAYTWFNRIIAIRFMEIHDYLPLTIDNQSLGIRVLSSIDGNSPDILKFSNISRSDLDIDLKQDYFVNLKNENEKFKYVLIQICKKLAKVIPQVFGGETDYIDLLIPDNILSENGFVGKLVNKIDEKNFEEVEIIGWLYQYYNSTEKERVMGENRAYKKEEIAYVTQLFTPDWIVKYLVDNSLGRQFYENDCINGIDKELKYLDTDNIKINKNNLDIEKIKFIDPCCGSGHILVYAFEVLYQLYCAYGYNKKDISKLILKNNLFGLDIDDRAGQLSILSVVLKARYYDKNIFNKEIIKELNISTIYESDCIEHNLENEISVTNREIYNKLLNNFYNAKEYGSLLKIDYLDLDELEEEIKTNNTIFGFDLREKVLPLIKCSKILTQKYDVVVTNPPYDNRFSDKLKDFLSKNYNDSKADLCTAFMENSLLKENGYLGMINQQSWMFLGTFSKLREKIIKNMTICNMIHLGARAFEEIGGEVVQTTAFILKNILPNNSSCNYYRLVDIKDAKSKEIAYLNDKNTYRYKKTQNSFLDIPGFNIGYWVDDSLISLFEHNKFGDIVEAKSGIMTGDDKKFIRFWFEVNFDSISFNNDNYDALKDKTKKFFPLTRGGQYRKWYGNLESVIYLFDEGYAIKHNGKNYRLRDSNYYFKEGITWTMITSNLSLRYVPQYVLFGNGGPTAFPDSNLYYYLGLLNSSIINELMKFMNPTMNIVLNDIENIPVVFDNVERINELVKNCIEISKIDWDLYETSWDFKQNYLVQLAGCKDSCIENLQKDFDKLIIERRNILKASEEEINQTFIKNYKLSAGIDYSVDDSSLSISNIDHLRDIKMLISYAVGCMFGRYQLNGEGIISKKNFNELIEINGFSYDKDNIIPISDNEDIYYDDDIVGLFIKFIKAAFGEKKLNENIDYIASVLGKKGTETSTDTIRRYFINNFYEDHLKMYQKCPIYWMFDSGKKNGFKCLIYLHRYDEQIVSKIRTKYLHNTLSIYQRNVEEIDYKLNNQELNTTDKRDLQNKKLDLNSKITECNEYDEMVGNVANKMIKLDIDDGISINYGKFIDDNGKSILAKTK